MTVNPSKGDRLWCVLWRPNYSHPFLSLALELTAFWLSHPCRSQKRILHKCLGLPRKTAGLMSATVCKVQNFDVSDL